MNTSRELKRKEEIRLRQRLLNGTYENDLNIYISKELSTVRAVAWGSPDMSSNPFKQIWDSVSTLYSEEPVVSGPVAEVSEILQDIGYWNLMKRVQRDTLALNELLIYVHKNEDDEIRCRYISPDTVDIKCSPSNSYDIRWIKLQVEDEDGEPAYIIWDADNLKYYAVNADDIDISEKILGGTQLSYPFIDGQKAYVPFVIYRAFDNGSTWNTFAGKEIVNATLRLCLFYTYYAHCVKNAAWSQRYAVNISIPGAEIEDETDREPISKIVSDPATVQLFTSATEGVQPQIGSFSTPIDIKGLMESIKVYEDRIYTAVVGQSVMRTSSDIRSGYSLAVSREEKIALQKGYAPTFKYSDKLILQLVSRLLGYSTSVKEWDIIYPSLIIEEAVK